ncbi:HsdM family class I SAM-dependent methyltransferase [Actinoallomurus sp. CA-150999]|uniref:HsdM family class I SAM-dependent methyltransferase n=1 Tax=Actinoallomurus sp. CA-150999 TaxID=3239887 RepID=UPI003D8DBF07
MAVGMTSGRGLFEPLWKFYDQYLSTKAFSAFDFAELVTYLLFLKLDDERGSRPAALAVRVVPKGLGWPSLEGKAGKELEDQFNKTLTECGKSTADPRMGIRRAIFHEARSPVRNPAKLAELIKDHIGARTWSDHFTSLPDMYGLLLDQASGNFEIKTGQTSTPVALTTAVLDCVQPKSTDTVLDPACGQGGLLLAAYDVMATEGVPFRLTAIKGADLDERMVRLATMNLLLRTGMPFTEPAPIEKKESLEAAETTLPTVVVCNPPFRSTAPEPAARRDFRAVTSKFPLSFLQHIMRALPLGGRAAVFVPDNVLNGAGSEKAVRQWLFEHCDVHTLLRLPTGVFARGVVMANVLFFDKVRVRSDGQPATKELWVYDFRTGRHFAAKENPLVRADLDDFVQCFHADQRTPTDHFKRFSYAKLEKLDFNLNISCVSKDSVPDELLSPRQLALEIAAELRSAAEEFIALAEALPSEENDPTPEDDNPEGDQ